MCEEGRVQRASPATSARPTRSTALVDGVLERHDKVDLLLNNAGGQYMAPAESITPRAFAP